jgi:hypothetical protein
VTPNHDISVAIIVTVVPSAMQAAIVFIEPEAGATVVAVAIVAVITAHIDAESACACCRG